MNLADLRSIMRGLAIGIDIGHTNIRAVRVRNGSPDEVLRERTDVPGGPEGVLDQAACLVLRLDPAGELPVGAGIAGQCDTASGVVRHGPNLFWPDVPFRDRLSQRLGVPVVMRNDVVMATMGEWRHGAGVGASDLACMFVGTGIGGGAVVGGRLLEGAAGISSHFGHISVQLDGPLCTCGRAGCVEAYAGGANVTARTRRSLIEDPNASPMLVEMCNGDLGALTGKMVAEAAGRGDRFALSVRDEMAAALSSAVASVINSFNPERVILGGTVLSGFPELYDLTVRGALDQCLKPARLGLSVQRSALGDLAGAVGAAEMALDAYG